MEHADTEVLDRLAREPRFAARYSIESTLGRGGMALVARAVDLTTGRAVAVKVMTGQWTPEAGERLLREGRVMAQIRHPNVLQVFDLGFIQGAPFLVTELATGGNLRQALAYEIRFQLPRVVEIMGPVCAALGALHEQGITHRDLKPDNILFGEDGQPRVADFGLAALAGGERLTETGAFVGSVQYAAPEMLTGEGVTPACDIYAVGVITYELLTGQAPFRAGTLNALYRAIMMDAPEHLSGPCPGLPADVLQAIHGCLAKQPADRPPSAADLARRMAGWTGLAPSTGAEVTLELAGRRPRSRGVARPRISSAAPRPSVPPSRSRAYVAVAALVLAAGAAWLRTSTPPPVPAPSPLAASEHASLLAELDRMGREATDLFEAFSSALQGRAALLMSDDSTPRFSKIRRRAETLREDARRMLRTLEGSGGRLPEAAFWRCRARAEEHFACWTTEQCRRMNADDDDPNTTPLAQAGDAEVLTVTRSFQENVTEMLVAAPPATAFDGRTLQILFEDTRAVARAVSMQEWGKPSQPLIRTATASFHRRLAERGPIGDAVVRMWNWGERGSFRKSDRETLTADAALLRTRFAGVTNIGPLHAVLGRMAREAEGKPTDPPPSPRAGG